MKAPMKLNASDIIALVSAVLAVLALFIGIYAALVTQRVATSGFQSAEKVKSDTATLLATLRSLMIKAALYSQQDPKTRNDEKRPDYIDIRPEKGVIQSFLISPTAVAYYAFVAQRSKKARDAGTKGEEWRIFFARLVDLSHSDNTYAAGLLAGKIEKMFDTVSDADLEKMSSNLEDIIASIKGMAREREHDTLIHVVVDEIGKGEPDFESFISFLRKQSINDPDVDLFWSAMSGDTKLAQDALKRGAKVSITEGEIKARYQQLWEKFKSDQKKGE
jgi:hypothetical protein